MADRSYDVTLAEVLLEFVRRLYAAEVHVAGMTYGANRRLAKSMGIHEQSLGKILVGAGNRQVTVAQIDSYIINKNMTVSEMLANLRRVAVALESDEPATKIEAVKLAGAKGDSVVRRDEFPDAAAPTSSASAAASRRRRPRRRPTPDA
jgi:hypothetical protein